MGNYKQWIIAAFSVVIAIIIIYAVVPGPARRTGEPVRDDRRRPVAPPGPLLDEDFNKVIPLEKLGADLNDPQSLAALGDQYFESGRYAQAIEIYKKVLEKNPNDLDTHNDLGLAYFYTKRPELALDTLKKGAEAGPSFQRIWLSLGFVLMRTGNDQEARPVLEKVIDLNPDTDMGQEAKRMLGFLQ